MSSTAQEVETFPRRIFIPDQDNEDMISAGTGQFNPEGLAGFSIHST